jgi:uncharacterized phage-associated protein
MGIFKMSILLTCASFFAISHAKCMSDEEDDHKETISTNNEIKEDKNKNKRSISPSFSPNIEDNKKLKMSNSEITIDESLEEIISKPILTLGKKYKPCNIQTTAKYFLFKEAEKFHIKQPGNKINKLKLQGMLHYAQSYFYAFYGERLFDEDMIINNDGYHSNSLDEWENYKNISSNVLPFVDSENKEKILKWFSPEKLDISPEAKEIIDITYELFSDKSGMDLKEKTTHDELYISLWEKGQKEEKNIPLQNLKLYRQPSEINNFQDAFIFNSIKNGEIEKVNTNFFLKHQKSSVKEIWSDLEKIYEFTGQIEEYTTVYLEKWPGQDKPDSIFSTLFFPQDLRAGDELLMPLLFRRNTPIILAFLSKKNNPEAKKYLCDFLDFLFSDSEEKKYKKEHKLIYKMKDKLREEVNEQFTKISQQKENDFYKGMSLLYLNEESDALKVFEENCKLEKPNPWCLYHAAILEKEIKNKENFWKRAEELLNKETPYSPEAKTVLKRLYLDKGRHTTSLEEGLKSYVQAWASGLPAAYLSIGKILKEDIGEDLKKLKEFQNLSEESDLKESLHFFEEAGNKGILTAYELAATHYIEQGNIEEAKRLYLIQGEKGDPEGYFNVARLYEDENNIGEAINFYKKAGFLMGGIEQAARLTNEEGDSSAEKENFVQELINIL